MSQAPLQDAESLHIGTVDFVSPDEIKIVLDVEAPDSVALNTGRPRPFPRVNSYVLMPVDDGYLVGQVEWLTVERSAFPKRRGMQDFGLVDLPYPLRRMSVGPLGMLRRRSPTGGDYAFKRGAGAFPSIGTTVVLPTDIQLRSIIESGERRRVKIGESPLADNASVCVDPDRLFGRHLAVLGNTGSGKSCTVAGLIRWSLEEAIKEGCVPNARFVVLDPNGEYSRAFGGGDGPLKARVFRVAPGAGDGDSPLTIPLWLLNSAEWCSFAQASARTQRPTLMQALQSVRDGQTEPAQSVSHELRRFLRTMLQTIRMEKSAGSPWGTFPKPKSFSEKLDKWQKGLEPELVSLEGAQRDALDQLVDVLESLCVPRREKYPQYDFTRQEIDGLIDATSAAHSAFGGNESDIEPRDVDAPLTFKGDSLLRSVEATAEVLNVSEYAETLLIRLRSLLKDARVASVIRDAEDMSLEDWLTDYIGADKAANGCISVLDLSLVPTEVTHIVAAVVARMVFEALRRYQRVNNAILPTVLVMEEAHTFVRRYREDVENPDAASVCCQVFERIAREGRKFGLGLVLSSQRPSELSETVLSQCNSFLLHRISNDRDQALVHHLVPDNLKGLLRELPSLPSQNAVLLGWATELPVLVRIRDLSKEQQPRSEDPDFWNVWTGKDGRGNPLQRTSEWGPVADDWRGQRPQTAAPTDSDAAETQPVA
jgi:uncharacterized protein